MQGVTRYLSQRETQQGLFLRILLDVPLSLERRALSSSHVRAFRRVGEEGRGGEEVWPSSVLLNFFSLKCAVCQAATFHGCVTCPPS